MGISPVTPNLSGNLKSFWKRPEGKTGLIALAVLAGGAIYGWGLIAGWVLGMLVDTVHIAILVGALVGGFLVLTNWRTHLAFRLLMRWVTGLFITIDPIGIIKDHLSEMKKRRDVMNEQIGNVRGAKQRLEDIIHKNEQTASQDMKMAEQAKTMAQRATAADEQQRMVLQTQLHANKAARLQQSNVGYAQLLTKITSLYGLLTKWATNVDYFIADTEDTVQQAEVQYKTINSAYSAFSKALAVFKGNASENEVYDATMEHLAEDASMKLGQMEDFQRVAQNFMDNIDVQNGAVNTDALAQLDKYEQNLLTPGNQATQFLLPSSTTPAKQPVPIDRTGTDDYSGFFSKK